MQMPYEAHMTMEPMNCTADIVHDRCEIWAPTQNPQAVKRVVQSVVKLGSDAVTVHVTLMGGGFGRRLASRLRRRSRQSVRWRLAHPFRWSGRGMMMCSTIFITRQLPLCQRRPK